MKRMQVLLKSAIAFAALLATGLPATAQEADRSNGPVITTPNRAAAQQRATQARGVPDGAENSDQPQMSDEEREAAMGHFLSGYYAGYTDGYADGSDDVVIEIVERQNERTQDQARAGLDSSRQQGKRRSVRDKMRNEMWGGAEAEGMTTLSGEIVGLKLVPIRNTNIEHRVARIATEDGRNRVADLGPKNQTDKFNLKEGDAIRVRGVPIMAGDMRIIAAQQVMKDGQSQKIEYLKPSIRDAVEESKDNIRDNK